MERYEVLVPSFASRFACKGPSCAFDCCKGWDVTLSREEYRKYRKNGIWDKCGEGAAFQMIPKDKVGGNHYVKIKMDAEKKCPFQQESGLCDIQCKYGEKMLSYTCRVFPRFYRLYEGMVEQGMSLGCEGVLELLWEEEKITLEKRVADFAEDEMYVQRWTQNTRRKHPILWSYFDIQTLCLLLLQAEGDTLEHRMVLLGMALHHINQLDEEGKEKEIPAYIENFLQTAPDISVGEILSDLGENPMAVLYSAQVMFTHDTEEKSKEYHDAMNRVVSRLKWSYTRTDEEHFTFEFNHDCYLECRKNFGKWIEGKEYFLENVMVAFLFSQNIPFFDLKYSLWDNYIYFVWAYSVAKMLLSVCLEPNSTQAEANHYLSVFFRTLGHSPTLFAQVVADFKKNGDSLGHLCVLLKSC